MLTWSLRVFRQTYSCSKSVENLVPRRSVVKRHFSLDSASIGNSNSVLNERMSASLENLSHDWSADDFDVISQGLDALFGNLAGREFSDIRKLSRRRSAGDVDHVGVFGEWETLSVVNSALNGGTQQLPELDLHTGVDHSDTGSAKVLNQNFEQSGVKKPAKHRPRDSSLTRASSLNTLVG